MSVCLASAEFRAFDRPEPVFAFIFHVLAAHYLVPDDIS